MINKYLFILTAFLYLLCNRLLAQEPARSCEIRATVILIHPKLKTDQTPYNQIRCRAVLEITESSTNDTIGPFHFQKGHAIQAFFTYGLEGNTQKWFPEMKKSLRKLKPGDVIRTVITEPVDSSYRIAQYRVL